MEEDKFWYTRFYKGEKENPFDPDVKYWAYKYWFYEQDYFVNNPNPNEEEFKDFMIRVISHIAETVSAVYGLGTETTAVIFDV